jgi:transcriptional regulator with XRE-family HTH domain
MTAREQRFAAANRLGKKLLRTFGEELRHARMALGLSQRAVAVAARTSQTKICRVEAGTLTTLSFIDAARVAAAVGLDLFVKAYPSQRRPRDKAQLRPLNELLANVALPLTFRMEAGLPSSAGPYPEQRAWDAMVEGDGEDTAFELESSLYDMQAQFRRIFLKQRDGHPDHLVVVVADTRHNRRVLAESEDLLRELPILSKADVIAALKAGRHPPSGVVLF